MIGRYVDFKWNFGIKHTFAFVAFYNLGALIE